MMNTKKVWLAVPVAALLRDGVDTLIEVDAVETDDDALVFVPRFNLLARMGGEVFATKQEAEAEQAKRLRAGQMTMRWREAVLRGEVTDA